MLTDKIPAHLLARADAELRATNDAIDACARDMAAKGRCDAQLAPIWAEKLRHTFAGVREVKYPDLVACNGGVIPIDTSVDPAALEWEYFMIDARGGCRWMDDEGNIAPSTAITSERHTGTHAETVGGYQFNRFDLERAAKANLPLQNMSAKADRRASDEKTEWVWMCGDSGKQIPGLLTHPNIAMSMAAFNAGATSRLFASKTGDEILTDFVTMIDSVPQATIEQHHVVTVFMPFSFIRRMRAIFVSATASGTISLWDKLRALYSGDESGQGKVTFQGLNMCEAARRLNPDTGTDTSGLSGDVMLALPAADKDALAFIRSRPYTQLAPQEVDFNVKILTHSKIGGVKIVYPLSVHVMQFGIV